MALAFDTLKGFDANGDKTNFDASGDKTNFDANGDKIKEECGVFGIYAPGEDTARLTYFGLHALQHRGQESAGIAVGDGNSVLVYKDKGLVTQVFSESSLATLEGQVAIGHVRYSTSGGSGSWESAQPHLSTIGESIIALAHNGNLVNSKALRGKLLDLGVS
ncbi:MAG: amidophosphoribosyltransferase, partial [Coriobacteriales bacterium]|nr:amidophosphoribosyltransferase [Coriobacteriales bacterium]